MEDDARDAWQPLDLSVLGDAPPERPTAGLGFTYAGRVHLRSGEPGSCKTLVSYLDIRGELDRGEKVVLIDLEMGPRLARKMLRDVGVSPDQLARQVYYIAPSEPIDDRRRKVLDDLLFDERPSLVIVDSFDAILELHELDPNKAADVQRFGRTFLAPLTRHGAAATVIDHAAKNRETRGRFSIGSQRKLGIVDVHLALEAKIPPRIGAAGVVKVTNQRDRLGGLPWPAIGELHIESDDDGAITWQLRAAVDETSDTFRPTVLMEKISRWLAHQPEPVSRNTIEHAGLGKKVDYVRRALDQLVSEGYVTETAGPRRARLFTHTQPFTSSDLVPLRPDEVATTSSDFVSLLQRDEDEVRDEDTGNGYHPDEVERLYADHADIAEGVA